MIWCLWSRFHQRYGLRFSQEHLFRFLKQDLLWTQVHVRTPDQFERWSWIVALAFIQLYLARPLGLACPVAVGGQRASGDPTAGPSGHAHHFVAAWHTRSVRANHEEKRPDVRRAFIRSRAPRYPVMYKTSKKQKKGKTVLFDLSFAALWFSFDFVFLGSEPATLWFSSLCFV